MMAKELLGSTRSAPLPPPEPHRPPHVPQGKRPELPPGHPIRCAECNRVLFVSLVPIYSGLPVTPQCFRLPERLENPRNLKCPCGLRGRLVSPETGLIYS